MTVDHRDGEAAAAALLEELAGLLRVAARRANLTVREGPPGCAWSFNFETDIVTVDPESLRSLAPDLCRGLALHEATHAAVTVLHRVVPASVFPRLHPLLNTIEDIRIEIWMRARFPGAAPWIRAYNDVFYRIAHGQPLPQSRQAQFLTGILHLWWMGAVPSGTLPEVEAALDACRDAIAAATDCQPPFDDDPEGILASQRAMWDIVRDGIVPTWERLVALDRREGIGRLATHELHERAARSGRGCCSRSKPGTVGDLRDRMASSLGTDGSDAYLAAWKRIAPLADRLGDELLRILVPRQRMRWTTGHSSGPRLDLRRAMQFEADPRLYRSLWCRPVLPHRRDPAIGVLLDRSGSMGRSGLVERAFEGLVLLVEVCRRIGVPVAVWSFADHHQEELSWDAPLDRPARRRLGLITHSCHGNTHMAASLDAVRSSFAARQADPKLLFVLGDGDPCHPSATLEAAGRLEEAGITAIGLGLGAGTANLARFFRCAATEVPPDRIVDEVARLLEASLIQQAWA